MRHLFYHLLSFLITWRLVTCASNAMSDLTWRLDFNVLALRDKHVTVFGQ